jgi:hypothetical protein
MKPFAALVGVAVAGAGVVGLLIWDASKTKATRDAMAKDDPTIIPVGMFPALKVGDVVLVDSALAKLPAPFSSVAQNLMHVDMILQDPAVVSVATLPPGSPRVPGLPFFSGTIPRAAILKLTPRVSLEV